MRKVFLLLMVISFVLAAGSIYGAVTIDDFSCNNSVDAAKAWVPQFGSEQTQLANIDGVKCLRFHCDFTNGVERDVWDKEVNLDLSAADYICCKIKVSNPEQVKYISIYLMAENHDYWSTLEAVPLLSDKWQTVIIPKSFFRTEGNPSGWNNIRSIRISVWRGGTENTDVYLADLQATTATSKNMLSNSGFEVCTTEKLPDFWGSGHWGLNEEAFSTDIDAWRARWGVDNTVSHSGKRSLRILGKKGMSELQAASLWVLLEKGKSYTLSAWMKSDSPDLPVTMKFDGISNREFKVSKTWKRYIFENVIPTDTSNKRCIIQSDSGTLWIDDVQLENSTVATNYMPADTDSSLTGEAVHRISRPADCAITPGPDTVTVNIDSQRRFLVDGKPFIPYAMGIETIPSPALMQTIAKAGFNTVVFSVFAGNTVAELVNVMNNAKANGLKAVVWVTRDVSTATLRNWVAGLKDCPALIAWYVYDEPNTDADRAVALEKYNVAKQIDPSRPAYINYIIYPKDAMGDISSLDNYLIPNQSPAMAGRDTSCMERFGSIKGRPTWIWLQSCGYAYYMSREPTGPEEECMVYSSLINGARGIKYFAQMPHTDELWSEIRQLGQEVKELTPILYSLETPPAVSTTSTEIEFVAKTYKGQNYIIALNKKPTRVKATFSVPGSDTASATVLFENRNASVKKGTIEDVFEGYQRHVYRL